MGCNCKKKHDILKKYSDTPGEDSVKRGIIVKFFLFLAQFSLGILLAPLIIVITIPFVIYVIICIMFGLEPNIVLKNPFKRKKKNKTDTV